MYQVPLSNFYICTWYMCKVIHKNVVLTPSPEDKKRTSRKGSFLENVDYLMISSTLSMSAVFMTIDASVESVARAYM